MRGHSLLGRAWPCFAGVIVVSYAVKEMYYTLQGEGANAGRAAVFLRFAGCNLWSGLEKDRYKGPGGCSQWCDTNFVGVDGVGGGKFASAEVLAETVAALWPSQSSAARPLVVCTGGEPLLQLDTELIHALSKAGFEIAVETNGTIEPPPGISWLTVSPKAGSTLKIVAGSELKLVYPQASAEPELFEGLNFQHFFLQPMDGPVRERSTQLAVEYCLAHPRWRLSLQTHKYLRIP
jgi:7-carboxy-7-deazaguanine synthase